MSMDLSKEGKKIVERILSQEDYPEEVVNRCIKHFEENGITQNYSKVLSYTNNNQLEVSANTIIALVAVLEKNDITIDAKSIVKLIEMARQNPSSNTFWLWGTGNPIEEFIFDKPYLVENIKSMKISSRKFGFVGSEGKSERDFDYDIVYYKERNGEMSLAPSYVVKYILAYLDTPYEDEREYKEKAIQALGVLDEDSFKKMIEKSFEKKFLKTLDFYVEFDNFACSQYQLNLYGRFGSVEIIQKMYDCISRFREKSQEAIKKKILLALSYSSTLESDAILTKEGVKDKTAIQDEYIMEQNKLFCSLN